MDGAPGAGCYPARAPDPNSGIRPAGPILIPTRPPPLGSGFPAGAYPQTVLRSGATDAARVPTGREFPFVEKLVHSVTETTQSTAARGSLSSMLLPELQALAGQLGITGASGMRKADLVAAISAHQAPSGRSGGQAASQEPARGARRERSARGAGQDSADRTASSAPSEAAS